MVNSNGTLVNRLTTSKLTNSKSSGIILPLIFVMKSLMLSMLYSLLVRGFKISAFLTKVFKKTNGYPSRVIHDSIRAVRSKMEEESSASWIPGIESTRISTSESSSETGASGGELQSNSSVTVDSSSSSAQGIQNAGAPDAPNPSVVSRTSEQHSLTSASNQENDVTPVIVEPFIILP